jgi:uncharacterized protein (UPF0332 family)
MGASIFHAQNFFLLQNLVSEKSHVGMGYSIARNFCGASLRVGERQSFGLAHPLLRIYNGSRGRQHQTSTKQSE